MGNSSASNFLSLCFSERTFINTFSIPFQDPLVFQPVSMIRSYSVLAYYQFFVFDCILVELTPLCLQVLNSVAPILLQILKSDFRAMIIVATSFQWLPSGLYLFVHVYEFSSHIFVLHWIIASLLS